MNALHAFHNRSDQPTRFISSSVYYHEILLETFGQTVDVNDPLPTEQEPTETEADRYLQVLKDAMKIHAYFPQANSSSGLEVLRDIEDRNSDTAETVHA
jgi:hypothetical protein